MIPNRHTPNARELNAATNRVRSKLHYARRALRNFQEALQVAARRLERARRADAQGATLADIGLALAGAHPLQQAEAAFRSAEGKVAKWRETVRDLEAALRAAQRRERVFAGRKERRGRVRERLVELRDANKLSSRPRAGRDIPGHPDTPGHGPPSRLAAALRALRERRETPGWVVVGARGECRVARVLGALKEGKSVGAGQRTG